MKTDILPADYQAFLQTIKTRVQQAQLEGLDLVFKKRGLPSIEELKKKQR